jgi:hypothetical protein
VLGRGGADAGGTVVRLERAGGERTEIAPRGSLPRWVP